MFRRSFHMAQRIPRYRSMGRRRFRNDIVLFSWPICDVTKLICRCFRRHLSFSSRRPFPRFPLVGGPSVRGGRRSLSCRRSSLDCRSLGALPCIACWCSFMEYSASTCNMAAPPPTCNMAAPPPQSATYSKVHTFAGQRLDALLSHVGQLSWVNEALLRKLETQVCVLPLCLCQQVEKKPDHDNRALSSDESRCQR